ncbi:hypothetical protein GCM10010969_32620 [Saccharibacillus kuerlensis]|uniref:Uncharacterized protein n=1 Tax=Saccharibacillus kuerlensis TaxID=459527 RepID=A0ABQ2L9R9_9BACL|nr:hypothetical protein GCM10010969_32620 [Saccharibacillus kuerlensis]
MIFPLGCNKSENPNASPPIWIYYEGSKYVGTEIYPGKPKNIIFSDHVTQKKDFTPGLKVFVNPENPEVVFINQGGWMGLKKVTEN